jgi:hypothetical protein
MNPLTKIDPETCDPETSIAWYSLCYPEVVWILPWMLVPHRETGCEYINTYNQVCSDIFNCNTNIQIRDIWEIYYSILYGSKSTQKEGSKRVQHMLHAVIKRLLKIEEDMVLGKKSTLDAQETFTKNLTILLSCNFKACVRATMAHLLVSLNGTRFTYSHDFSHLLVLN